MTHIIPPSLVPLRRVLRGLHIAYQPPLRSIMPSHPFSFLLRPDFPQVKIPDCYIMGLQVPLFRSKQSSRHAMNDPILSKMSQAFRSWLRSPLIRSRFPLLGELCCRCHVIHSVMDCPCRPPKAQGGRNILLQTEGEKGRNEALRPS